MFTLALFDHIAKQTQKHKHNDWVQPADPGHGRNSNKKKRPFCKSCEKTDEGAQHCVGNEANQFNIIQNYIIL